MLNEVVQKFLKQVSWVSCHEFEVGLNKFQICLQISTFRRFVFSSWHLKEESPLDFIKNILHILYDCTYNAMESVSKNWDILNPESGSEVWTSGLCNLKTQICTSISLSFKPQIFVMHCQSNGVKRFWKIIKTPLDFLWSIIRFDFENNKYPVILATKTKTFWTFYLDEFLQTLRSQKKYNKSCFAIVFFLRQFSFLTFFDP